jgi:hypothetical protein
MESVDFLGIEELRGLKVIGRWWVAADYWKDALVMRYRRHDLVSCHGGRLHLTEAGRRACADRVLHADSPTPEPRPPS